MSDLQEVITWLNINLTPARLSDWELSGHALEHVTTKLRLSLGENRLILLSLEENSYALEHNGLRGRLTAMLRVAAAQAENTALANIAQTLRG